MTSSIERRTFLRFGVATAAGLTLSACSRSPQSTIGTTGSETTAAGTNAPTTDDNSEPVAKPGRKVLLAFFSRAGENYFNGGRKELVVGNTEVVAGMIRDSIGCDVFQIKAVEPYSDRYEPTVQRNVREQDANARPGIVDMPSSIEDYDSILLGSPIWNMRAPRIMLTFADRYDFTGKTVHPFTTYAMSGLGDVVDEYAKACRGATLGEALAIRGEEAEVSRSKVEGWLRRITLLA